MTTPTAVAPAPAVPTWLRETDIALAANSQVALTGNLRDLMLLPNFEPGRPPIRLTTVTDALRGRLSEAGHRNVIVFNRAHDPLTFDDAQNSAQTIVAAARQATGDEGPLVLLLNLIERVTAPAAPPCCLIIQSASRLRTDGESMTEEMHDLLVTAENAMVTAQAKALPAAPGEMPRRLYNTVFWLLDREGDLPHWLVGDDLMRVISVPMPTHTDRKNLVRMLANSLPRPAIPFSGPDDERLTRMLDEYAAQTAGLTLRSISEINRLAIDRRIPADHIGDAIRTYRVGIPDNPWHDETLRAKLRDATEKLERSVFGQPAAVRKSADILVRSAMGLTGAQSSSSSNRPQGVLFFAGPTGVGKTELAKSMAELVFGRKDAFLRFDMSEFSSEHSEARLIGAPPGYIGHNAGGELTNSIRQDPFRLVLFDEVEKAHPRILDKFLQILEDGRLTDGNGSTVYFSETLIVFTSNLGVYTTAPDGTRVPVVQRGADYDLVESSIKEAVTEHFTTGIGRPELLNRIGDNIVVFDFIAKSIGEQIVDNGLRNIIRRVRENPGLDLSLTPEAIAQLKAEACKNLDMGGRGINNAMESILINPLARALFTLPAAPQAATVTGFVHDNHGWSVELR